MAREKTGFDQDGFCLGCDVHQRVHRVEIVHGAHYDQVKYHCPDVSLPDAGQDDDPWAEESTRSESRLATLFDSYD